ncbi:alpha/beta-hydrolase [Byssothecium circinans]|uniref:Carboxylic ester hydrolase n=1 Tax=Byssothecium circinans TaxID=147558 RepID=A0A6A5TWU7_9PLEO|nr:alpha/beta-hydrolase [Byssothecium circinans]
MKVTDLLLLALPVSALTLQKKASYVSNEAPTVKLRNGTYQGVSSPEYQQDFFLGIPFAQPPVGDLRFRNPKPLNTSWEDSRNATQFSRACVGYGYAHVEFEVSEDCLYLNVIRPSGINNSDSGLPVAVWIHGGAFSQGSGIDRRQNLSFVVQESVAHGTPMLGVTINYRLAAWGFLSGYEASEDSGSNHGIRDQRLALEWIQENIAAFGGDPKKVTIWGQSAGAASVGLHITAYDGRDDGLFRSGIMQSGAPAYFGDQSRTEYYQGLYRNLTSSVACNGTSDSLACLRKVPYTDLNAALNTTAFQRVWWPQIDGDIIKRHSSQQLAEGSFIHVPILIGATTDEGTSFTPPGANSTEIVGRQILASETAPRMNASFLEKILAVYPDDPSQNLLANLGPTFRPGPPEGLQYRRAVTYHSDAMFIAHRRGSCQTWASFNLTAYCFRFNAIPAWADQLDGAAHFVDVAFSMLALSGDGYAPYRKPPFEGKPKSYTDLARLMSNDFISFVTNGHVKWEGREAFGVPEWPQYSLLEPRDFVYDANVTSFVEPDTFREEAIALINSAALEVYGR